MSERFKQISNICQLLTKIEIFQLKSKSINDHHLYLIFHLFSPRLHSIFHGESRALQPDLTLFIFCQYFTGFYMFHSFYSFSTLHNIHYLSGFRNNIQAICETQPFWHKKLQAKSRVSFRFVFLNHGQKQPTRGFLRKSCSENMQQSAISIKLPSNYNEITLRHRCSPVNLLHIFRTPCPKNSSEWLLLHYQRLSRLQTRTRNQTEKRLQVVFIVQDICAIKTTFKS